MDTSIDESNGGDNGAGKVNQTTPKPGRDMSIVHLRLEWMSYRETKVWKVH